MNRIPPWWRTVLICVLLAGATLATFSSLLHSDFVQLDDREYVTENPHVLRGITWDNAKWALRTGYASNWHPLTWLSHMLDVQLFGLKAGGHHLTSLLFHTANSVLLFLLLHGITRTTWRSAMVAVLFALHPLHVESVAWVSERKDVLSAFFFLLTLWAYARYAREQKEVRPARAGSERGGEAGKAYSLSRLPYSVFRNKRGVWYMAALALFALGLMSKPMLVTLPFVLLLLDYWPLCREEPPAYKWKLNTCLRILLEKVPFLTLAAASIIVTLLVQDKAIASAVGLPLSVRIPNAIVSYAKYLGKTLWPTDLAIFYPHPQSGGPSLDQVPTWQVALAATALVSISICALRLKRPAWFVTGWFWYLGMLVPVIGLVQVGLQAMADRYSYLPLIGIFICLVWGFSELFGNRRFGKALLVAIASATIATCMALTHRQAGYWRDNRTVFQHAIDVTAHNSVAHYNLGVELVSHGKYEEAIAHYRAALESTPNDANVRFGLGIALSAMGKAAEAMDQYEAGLQLEPENARARNNLGALLLSLGRRMEAIEQYTQALRLKPDYAQAHYNLGFLLVGEGKLEEATTHFTEALRLLPHYPEAGVGLGNVLMMQGKLVEARTRFEELVRLYPANAEAHLGLGEVLRRMRKPKEALPYFAEAARLKPDQPLAHYNMGIILLEQGKFSEAEVHLAEALRNNSNDSEALTYLARTQARQKKMRAAIATYERAITLRPNSAEALSELAWILATHPDAEVRNGSKAVHLAERAVQVSGGRQARFLGTLDAAYAEVGKFVDAIKTAEQTRSLALAAGQKEIAQAAEKRLALYARQQPFRQ